MDINILTALNDNIRIDRDKCTGCARCVDVCILDNLRLQLSPCRQACPVGMNCQGYIQHLARGEMEKGSAKVRETLPFGDVLGRVCSRPCEAACNRARVDGQPVAIRDLKRFLADRDEDPAVPPIERERPEKIAVVGAGPAGLTAAFYLRESGFQVTLFDKYSAPGGMMRWGIPEFRLPGKVLEKALRFVSATGIKFEGNRALGKDLHMAELEEKFDAVLLALGAHREGRLNIPGEDGESVVPVLQFLKEVRDGKNMKTGDRVIVVGGGNAAVDAAQSALRLGARSVALVCLEQRHEMPAFTWEIADAEEEGVSVWNGWGPTLCRREDGKLTGVAFKKCTAVCDEDGCFCPAYDEKDTMDLQADTVIVAIGQKPEISSLDPSILEHGGVAADTVTFQTNRSKVFAAGDILRPRTLVEAMAQGKEAALSIERLFNGEDLHYGRSGGKPIELEFEPDWSRARPGARHEMPSLPAADRKGFDEVASGYSGEEAVAEAKRCLNCGIPVGQRTCWFCLPCEIECPEEALYLEIPYLLR